MKRFLQASLLVLAVALGGALVGRAAPSFQNGLVTIRGTLGAISGANPVLKAGGQQIVLAGQSPYILKTLQDKRLRGQELEVIGTRSPRGSFVVQRLYAVHNGQLYRIHYYCEVCNITYNEPGHCYCCGRETKLQEVPVQNSSQ